MANAEEVRGDGHQAPLKTMARIRGWPPPPAIIQGALGLQGQQPTAHGRCLTGGPPTGAEEAQAPASGARGVAAQAHDQLWAAGGGGSRPRPSKGCRGGSSCSHPTKGSRGGTAHVPAHLRAAGRAAHAPAKQMQPAGQPLALGGQGVAGSGAAQAPASGTG